MKNNIELTIEGFKLLQKIKSEINIQSNGEYKITDAELILVALIALERIRDFEDPMQLLKIKDN